MVCTAALFSADHLANGLILLLFNGKNLTNYIAIGEMTQLLPTKIETQFKEAGELDSIDALYSPLLIDNGSGAEAPTLSHQPDRNDDLPTQWLKWQVCQTGALLWRAEALHSIGGWSDAMPRCQDNELCLRAIKAGRQNLALTHWQFPC